jgi:hypothetical protein
MKSLAMLPQTPALKLRLHRSLMIAIMGFVAMTGLAQPLWAAQSAHFYSTLKHVHVAGFQGWFACPNDPTKGGWGHWFRGGTDPRQPDSLAVDVWPDTSELDPDEKCPTGLRLRSGGPAYLYSDQNPKTVARQFEWMKHYDIDGVALQRFGSVLDGNALQRQFDTVLSNVKTAAETHQRGFFIMYDGIQANRLDAIKRDWQRLTEEEHLTDSPAYIFHRGKPVVGLWGLGFTVRDLNPGQVTDLITFFRTAKVPATVLGGVPAHWRLLDADSRSEPEWASVYRSLDIISPWAAGRFADNAGADNFAKQFLVPDLAEAKKYGIDYMAVAFPGFSWHNGAGRATNSPLDVFRRQCGGFYKHQIDNILKAGADMLYTAMFDEANEGTAMFKMAVHSRELPDGVGMVPLDDGGCQAAKSDMYLRLARQATRALRQQP